MCSLQNAIAAQLPSTNGKDCGSGSIAIRGEKTSAPKIVTADPKPLFYFDHKSSTGPFLVQFLLQRTLKKANVGL